MALDDAVPLLPLLPVFCAFPVALLLGGVPFPAQQGEFLFQMRVPGKIV